MIKKNFNLVAMIVLLILLAVFSRFVSHAWNFTLMGGVAIFAGGFFRSKAVAAFVVLGSLLLSDAVIGFHNQMLPVYFGFLVMMALGSLLTVNSSRTSVLVTSLVGSLSFFLITNFSVWSEAALYPQTFSGLIDCYLMGIPFFKNQLIGDIVSSSALFAIAKAAQSLYEAKLQDQYNQ